MRIFKSCADAEIIIEIPPDNIASVVMGFDISSKRLLVGFADIRDCAGNAKNIKPIQGNNK